jgi:glutamine cyclotransferase
LAETAKSRHFSVRRALGIGGLLLLAVSVLVTGVFLLWPMQAHRTSSGGYEVVRMYPHDARAFTQGLVVDRGELFESTGRKGATTLRRVHLSTGLVLQEHRLDDQVFGEGLAVVDDRLFQLSWTDGTGFVYDRDTFRLLKRFTYSGEGWGLTYDGAELVMSDGTGELRFLDPVDLVETHRLTVTDENGPVTRLNELEYVRGEIWANVWQTDLIARISPQSGVVIGYLDLSGLLDRWAWNSLWPLHTDVLNGIAYDARTDRLFVTGKLWPVLVELRRPR